MSAQAFGRSLQTYDLFIHNYRVSAQIDTRHRTMNDLLNDRLTAYLELFDSYVSRVDQPGHIVAHYPQAMLRKDGLSLVIVPEDQGRPSGQRGYSYLGRTRYQAFLALPFLEVTGEMFFRGKLDLHHFLVKEMDQFFPVGEGIVRLALAPDITFDGEAFLVNKERTEFFGVTEPPSVTARI
ncbi:MAG: hypothetical protein ACOYZ7_04740 [Chloroflexota bacterium]